MEVLRSPTLDFGVAAAPLPGQTESGDRYLVQPFPGGTLVAVVDALGHGHRAAQVAVQTIEILLQRPSDPVGALFLRCHQALRNRYGVTMSLASFDWGSHLMTWLGIGNVAGVLMPHSFRPESPVSRLLVRGGVVGGDLPDLDPVRVAFTPGDTLVLATDGIHDQFADELPAGLEPKSLAEHIFAHHAKSTDDALVLAARYHVNPNERGR
jgi:negative regulator of sigma-B (phosphoserine phosphatase)